MNREIERVHPVDSSMDSFLRIITIKNRSQDAIKNKCNGLVCRKQKAIWQLERLKPAHADSANRVRESQWFLDAIMTLQHVVDAWEEQSRLLRAVKGSVAVMVVTLSTTGNGSSSHSSLDQPMLLLI